MLTTPTPLQHHHTDPPRDGLLSIDVCGSAARLTGTEQQTLAATFADAQIPAGLRCSLTTHHRHRHLALAVPLPTTGRARWLVWGRGRRRFIDAPSCGARPDRSARYGRTGCFLPRDHAGLHSFDYHPDLVWPVQLRLHDQGSWHCRHRQPDAADLP